VPNQQTLVAFVRQRITRLRAGPIKQMKLYVRQTGEEFPAWSQELEFAAQPAPVVSHPSLCNLPIRKCKGDRRPDESLSNQGHYCCQSYFKVVAFPAGICSSAESARSSGIYPQTGKRLGLCIYQASETLRAANRRGDSSLSQDLNCGTTVACGKATAKSSATCPAGKRRSTALMNRSLQPKGITVVRAALK